MAQYIGKKETIALQKWVDVTTTDVERSALFETTIHPAFKKLADNLVYKLGQSQSVHARDLRDRTVSHLFDKIHKYNWTRGSTPFSFFNVVAQNFIKHQIKRPENAKTIRLTNTVRRENDSTDDNNQAIVNALKNNNSLVDNSYLNAGEEGNEFIRFLKMEIAKFIVNTPDKKEKLFLKHLIQILDNHHHLDISKKNEFYCMMRTLSNFNNREIGKYRFKIMGFYEKVKKRYIEELI